MTAVDEQHGIEGDLDRISLLDFDPMCEAVWLYRRPGFFSFIGMPTVKSRPCDRAATWVSVCRSCGARALICDQHRREGADLALCHVCGAKGRVYFDYIELPTMRGHQ